MRSATRLHSPIGTLIGFFCTVNALSQSFTAGKFDVKTFKSSTIKPDIDTGFASSLYVSTELNCSVNAVDERYVSVTLDASLIADHWPCFDFR
jgi:hypothetical protein